MKALATHNLILTLAVSAWVADLHAAPDSSAAAKPASSELDLVDGPNVRVMRHEDGSRTVFIKSPDGRTLTRKMFTTSGTLKMMTVFRMDQNQNPTGCKIYDGSNELIYKVRYGYRKSDGKLVQEEMYDARVVRKDPATGKEMPVQVVKYCYDAQGNRSAPMAFNLLPGKTFQELFGEKSSALDANPFQNPDAPVNPNSRRINP
jgi:hypothetical protein